MAAPLTIPVAKASVDQRTKRKSGDYELEHPVPLEYRGDIAQLAWVPGAQVERIPVWETMSEPVPFGQMSLKESSLPISEQPLRRFIPDIPGVVRRVRQRLNGGKTKMRKSRKSKKSARKTAKKYKKKSK